MMLNNEIVIICGSNAAGKSTLATDFVNNGYVRINRDETHGTLEQQVSLVKKELLRRQLIGGKTHIVLDNTYATIESRESIINLAKEFQIPIRCVWLTTSFEDSQFNACLRMMKRCGRLLMPEDVTNDPNLFPPAALFSYRNRFENLDKKQKYPGKQEPLVEHGFYRVDKIHFVRQWDKEYVNKALILDFDDTLRRSTGQKNWPEDPSEVEILPGRREKLLEYQKQGYLLLGASNQSAIAKGLPVEKAIACFDRTCELLGLNIEYKFCPHSVPPVKCYCRKPHCGIGAYFIYKHKLNPSLCIMVGDQKTDATFAKRCGFQFVKAEDFFA